MSSIIFAGTTLWNDASTGRGRPIISESLETINWVLERIPGNGGIIAKNNGIKPGPFVVAARYWLASGSDFSTLYSAISNAKASVGTLSFPPSTSVSNCILLDARFENTPVQPREGSTHRYERYMIFQFQALG
jgi:hypothetical protein